MKRLAILIVVVGLLLAAAGLYGIMAFSAGRRTREIGIRLALGAARGDVLRMMIGEGVRLGAIGIGVGLALAAATTALVDVFSGAWAVRRALATANGTAAASIFIVDSLNAGRR